MNMPNLETTLVAYDGLSLHRRSWNPESQETGQIFLLHGLGEHSGRYAHLGAFFARHGISFHAIDLRGHGNSEGRRGDVPSIEAYHKDTDSFLDSIPANQALPRFLFGHSLGAILAISYGIRRKPSLDGLICSGLALHNALELQSAKVAAVKILGRLIPRVTIASGLEQAALSRDAAVVEEYKNDPLVHDQASLGWGSEILREVAFIWEHACELQVPSLLMHGNKDRVAYSSSSIEIAQLVKTDCTLKIWDEMYHEIHNEYDRQQVLEFMLGWIKDHSVLRPVR